MAELPPPSPRHARVDRMVMARQVLTHRRRTFWLAATYLLAILILLAVVAAQISPWLWISLGVVVVLVYIFGWQMYIFGWDLRAMDEQLRTMGEWRLCGTARNGEPATLVGHMVYCNRDDAGRLTSFVHVDLSADD